MSQPAGENNFRNGVFALGIFIGIGVGAVFADLSTGCSPDNSSLWFCGESEAVVIASLSTIESVLTSFAWPAAVVLIALLFKRNIERALLGLRIGKVKIGQVEAEFVQAVDKAEQSVRDESNADKVDDLPPSQKFVDFLEVDKRFAVLAAWLEIEDKILKLYEHYFPSDFGEENRNSHFTKYVSRNRKPARRKTTTLGMLQRLEFPPLMFRAIDELRKARNAIAHQKDAEFSTEEVLRFLDVAADIDGYLEDALISRNLN